MAVITRNQVQATLNVATVGWVTAERYCPCKRLDCRVIRGGSEVTFKPLVARFCSPDGMNDNDKQPLGRALQQLHCACHIRHNVHLSAGDASSRLHNYCADITIGGRRK
ncbi:hypothetical protein J6590_007686 [Homalodisca vitripennis]|nr:hypothetical protein J6590_007686 [Homalodisca vitripennis]